MSIPADSFIDNENHTDVTSNELVCDICGYILHGCSQVLECEKCKVLLKRNESQLPENYPPANYTLSRTYGYLQLQSRLAHKATWSQPWGYFPFAWLYVRVEGEGLHPLE